MGVYILINTDEYYSKEELIKLTQDLIRIPSHKDVPNQEKKVAEFIQKFAKKNGLEAKLQKVTEKRSNVLIYLRGSGSGKSLMLNGHTDTIQPYNMTIDPFSGEVRDGCIWGRGATDMKGPIASMLMTMVALKRAGIKLKGDLIFAGVIGEENRSEGTEYLIESGIRTDAAIVGEPSNYEYTIGHRGLEWLKIVIKGKSAHGGVPHMGINAIEKAANLIQKMRQDLYPKLEEKYNHYMGSPVMNIGTIDAGGQPNKVPDSCSIQIDRRYVEGESIEGILREYQEIIDKLKNEDPYFDAKVERDLNGISNLTNPPLFTPPRDPIVRAVKESIKDVTGKIPELCKDRGWTDAALLSKFGKIPSVVFGPGSIAQSHTADEHIAIEDLVNAVIIYTKIIERFCGVNE